MNTEGALTRVTEAELAPWREPEQILEALAAVRKNDVNGLAAALAGLLEHEDADVREEAARVLFVAGKNTEHRARLVELLRNDPELSVRCTAAYGVAGSSSDSTRKADSALLLSIVQDPSEDGELRRSAYEAMLIVFRRPKFPAMNRPFDPATDVDWKWLEQVTAQVREEADP